MSTHSIHELEQSERIAGLEAQVRELREANARYEDIMSNMALGILEVDIDERILRANPKFCQIVGYNEAELLGKRASDVLLDSTELDTQSYSPFLDGHDHLPVSVPLAGPLMGHGPSAVSP